jgi:hypothetical protein
MGDWREHATEEGLPTVEVIDTTRRTLEDVVREVKAARSDA